MNIERAIALLETFNCAREDRQIENAEEKENAQKAVTIIAAESDYQILGICADNFAEAIVSLQQYSQALSLPLADIDVSPTPGVTYLKFNAKNGNLYAEAYLGNHRGVLISCQSFSETGLNGTFGHLPLDLFGDR
jgi:hypothetical protein